MLIRWRGRWEGGSGWGIHVNPWLIHVNVWQKSLQYCKVISLQLIKINGKKKVRLTFFVSCSVVSNSLQSYGLEPPRPLCPWNSPGKNTGVGSHFFLQGIFLAQRSNPGVLHYRQILYHLSHIIFKLSAASAPPYCLNSGQPQLYPPLNVLLDF